MQEYPEADDRDEVGSEDDLDHDDSELSAATDDTDDSLSDVSDLDLAAAGEEKHHIETFTQRWIDLRAALDRCRARREELTNDRVVTAEVLLEYMREHSLQCVPVTVDSKRMYLRVLKKAADRPLGEITLTKCLAFVTYDSLRHCLADMVSATPEGKPPPRLWEVLVETVCRATAQGSRYERESIAVVTSKPRKRKVLGAPKPKPAKRGRSARGGGTPRRKARPRPTSEDDGDGSDVGTSEDASSDDDDESRVHKLSPRAASAAYRLYVIDRELSELHKMSGTASAELRCLNSDFLERDRTGCVRKRTEKQIAAEAAKRERHLAHNAARDSISAYVRRLDPLKKSVKIEARGTDGRREFFYLREKLCGSAPPFPRTMYRGLVESAGRNILQSVSVDPEVPCNSTTLAAVDLDQFLPHLRSEVVKSIAKYKADRTSKVRTIRLDKVPVRKRKEKQDSAASQASINVLGPAHSVGFGAQSPDDDGSGASEASPFHE